jgi:hypothetical protein
MKDAASAKTANLDLNLIADPLFIFSNPIPEKINLDGLSRLSQWLLRCHFTVADPSSAETSSAEPSPSRPTIEAASPRGR